MYPFYLSFVAATPGEDFYLYTFSIEAISTVDGPDNNLCFNLYTSEDVFVEYDEYFMVGISFPYSVSNHLMVEISEGKDTAAVCIKDNDRKSLTILILILYNHVSITLFFVQAYSGTALFQKLYRDKIKLS